MHAKLFTAALFTVVMSFVVFLSDVFYWNQLYGLSGFGEPIYTLQEYALCPLDLNLFGALAVTYLLRLAILMMFTFLTTAISSFFKMIFVNDGKHSGRVYSGDRLRAFARSF